MTTFSCDEVRELAYDLRLGELTENDARAVRRHVEGCAACAEHMARLDDLLQAPIAEADVVTASMDFDALFDNITQTIDRDDETLIFGAPPTEQTIVHTPSLAQGGPELTLVHMPPQDLTAAGPAPASVGVSVPPAPSRKTVAAIDDTHEGTDTAIAAFERSGWWSGVAAALLTAGLAWLVWQAVTPEQHTAPTVAETIAEADITPPAFPQRAVPNRAIEIRASADAAWDVARGDDGGFVLDVTRGEVLVEFLPVDDASLHVTAGTLSFDVVGTVFLVTRPPTDAPRVDVLHGAVEVHGASERVRVGSQESSAGAEVVPIDDTRFAALAKEVDLDMHEARLTVLRTLSAQDDYEDVEHPPTQVEVARAEARAEARRVVPEPQQERAEPVVRQEAPAERVNAAPEPPAEQAAMVRAREAMARRAWAEAASALEDAVVAGEASGAARLDLARLYTRRLGSPTRAIPHLRAFVVRYPDDPTTDSALRELCRISDAHQRDEPLCP